jgi:hypothetical protein
MSLPYEVKVDGNRVTIRFNVREYILNTVKVPMKYIQFTLNGDVLEVVAEVDTEQVLSKIG